MFEYNFIEHNVFDYKVIDSYQDKGIICFVLDNGEIKKYDLKTVFIMDRPNDPDELDFLLAHAKKTAIMCIDCYNTFVTIFPKKNQCRCPTCELVHEIDVESLNNEQKRQSDS